jgi:Tol biopolymer transport system component
MFKAHGKLLVVPFMLVSAVVFPVLAAICADRTTGLSADQPKILAITQITHDGVNKASLLSDGSNLYVSESQARQQLVAKISLQTTARAVLSTALSNPQALDISPDRKRILVSATPSGSRTNELWTLPLGAGAPVRLGDLIGRDAAWSPDGQLIAFARQSALYTANAAGAGAHEIFTADGSIFVPRVSLDGKRIRFTVGNAADGTTQIWEIGADGSRPHALLPNFDHASTACCGAWTADGRYYIFQVTQGTLTTLWSVPDSGAAQPVQLTNGPTSFGNVSVSRDSSNIWAIGVKPTAEAIVFKEGKLAPVLGGASATDVDFSADGQWATYVSIPERELWRCRADGSDKLKLASAPERAALPRWSPDGKQIAYVRLIVGQADRIALVSRDGGPVRDLLDENKSQMDANWSTDGTHMMIGSFAQDKNINIRLIDLSTKQVSVLPGSEGIFSPRWSPDGKYVAALSPDSTKVLIFDFATKQWNTWFSEPAGAVSYPVWSADSQSLYFDDLVTGVETIQKARLGEDKPETVFTLPSFDRFPGPFGLWSGRTPDGKWMFVRDRSSQEVYQLSVSLP